MITLDKVSELSLSTLATEDKSPGISIGCKLGCDILGISSIHPCLGIWQEYQSMILSPDSQVILLLCSHLGLPSDSDTAPFTLRDWNPLARKLQANTLRLGALLVLSEQDLVTQLSTSSEEANSITRLLEHRGSLAIELERLESLGLRVLTCADEDYPLRYRERLRDAARGVLFYPSYRELLGQPEIAVVG